MPSHVDPLASSAPAARLRHASLPASLAILAVLAACAAPATRVAHIHEEPAANAAAAYVEYGTVRRIDVTETRRQAGAGGPALGALVGVELDQAEARSATRYRVLLQLDDGRSRALDLGALDGLHVGERVRVDGDSLSPA